MLQRTYHTFSPGLRRSWRLPPSVPRCFFGCLLAAVCVAPGVHAQQPETPKVISPSPDALEGGRGAVPVHPMTKQDVAALSHDLEVIQSKQLLELATELKKQLGQTSENTLSLNVIRKAEQIEHVARSLKERIKLNLDTKGNSDYQVQNSGR